jgi:hypothetical protein
MGISRMTHENRQGWAVLVVWARDRADLDGAYDSGISVSPSGRAIIDPAPRKDYNTWCGLFDGLSPINWIFIA